MPQFLEQFRSLIRDDGQIDLARCALTFASEAYPDLSRQAYLARLDALANEARGRLRPDADPDEVVRALAGFLSVEKGFRGNRDEYDDPRNSFLNEVLDRGLGLPITLSTVWTEVARRLRLPIVGVGMPGHFIVKYQAEGREILIDPFEEGKVLTRDDCQARLDQLFDGTMPLEEEHLAPTPARDVLARMLRNLKSVYAKSGSIEQALWVADYILELDPDNAMEHRDRGAFRFHAGEWEGAEDDLARALDAWPGEEEERTHAEQMLLHVRRMRRRMN